MNSVLIVDDNNLIRMYLKTMLGNLDIQNIYEAGNGEKAINLAEQYQPGLVLLDINLPDYDGIDLLEIVTHYHPR